MCLWDGKVLTLVFMDASFWKGLLCNLSHMISLCRPGTIELLIRTCTSISCNQWTFVDYILFEC